MDDFIYKYTNMLTTSIFINNNNNVNIEINLYFF